jgi:hypothetical protein
MSNTGGEVTEGSKLNDSATFTNYSNLNESEAILVPDLVKVNAPSNLPEGYQFTVLANNLRLRVAVVRNLELEFAIGPA